MSETRNVHYTILALKVGEAEKVISNLKTRGFAELSGWLAGNYKKIYGESSSGWRPLQGLTIDSLLKMEPLKEYKVDYLYYDEIIDIDNPTYKFARVLSAKLNLIFIDPFVVFIDKYGELISKIDASTARGDNCLCCFVMPDIGSEQFHDLCFQKWESVIQYYIQGINHRIVYKQNDMLNFKNNIRQLPLSDSIHPSNANLFENGKMARL